MDLYTLSLPHGKDRHQAGQDKSPQLLIING